jgi:hypothetical protein
MAKSPGYGNLDILNDPGTFGFERKNQLALDGLAERFASENILIENYKATAIQEFRLAAATSALTAKGVCLTEKGRGRGLAAAKENIEALRKVREILLHLAPVANVPGHEYNVLKYGREIEAAKRHLNNAIEAVEQPAKLRIYNYKRTNIFKRTFIKNLGGCWEKLTGKNPPISDHSYFVEFARASFLAIGITETSDVGRYAKDVFGSKRIS